MISRFANRARGSANQHICLSEASASRDPADEREVFGLCSATMSVEAKGQNGRKPAYELDVSGIVVDI